MKICICLICLRPNKIWCNFLNTFTKYKIYMIIDCENFNIDKFIKNYKNITFIQIKQDECILNGFQNLNLYFTGKSVSGWEKSIYYFTMINQSYHHIWFFEDDIFFYNETTIENIDSKYDNQDFLSNNLHENTDGKKDYWHWKIIQTKKYKPPYYSCMVCGIRLSKNVFSYIKEYADKYKTLFFLEAFFPTIVKKNNLTIEHPQELKTIMYRCEYNENSINKSNLFHPVKNLQNHIFFRDYLSKQS